MLRVKLGEMRRTAPTASASRPARCAGSAPRRFAIRAAASRAAAALRRRQGGRRRRTLGLETIGDLLEHLPRDRREARAIGELIARGDRDARRRGPADRPAAGAPARDAAARRGDRRRRHRHAEGHVLQPAVARRALPARHAARAARQARRRNRFRVQAHAPTERGADRPRGGRVAHYPATEGSPRPRSSRWCTRTPRLRRRARAAAAARAARERLPDRAARSGRPLPAPSDDQERAGAGSRSTSCCSPSSRCCGAARADRRARVAPVLTGRAS